MISDNNQAHAQAMYLMTRMQNTVKRRFARAIPKILLRQAIHPQ